jgi:hypothetical protein
MKARKDLLTEREQKKLYLVHHMHHLESAKGARHELHHCFLFSEKNMEEDKYQMKHIISEGKLFHVLDKNFSGKLYDHKNRTFKIIVKKLRDKKWSIIE